MTRSGWVIRCGRSYARTFRLALESTRARAARAPTSPADLDRIASAALKTANRARASAHRATYPYPPICSDCCND
jgi:hypothetical protein